MEEKIKCPRCGSEQLTANKHGFSLGKAAAGFVLTGGVGLVAGAHGSNKIDITCLKCGFKFKPGEGKVSSQSTQTFIAPPKPQLDDYQLKAIEANTVSLLRTKSLSAALKYYMESTGSAAMNSADKVKSLAEQNDLILPKYSSMTAYRKGEEREMRAAENRSGQVLTVIVTIVVVIIVGTILFLSFA